METLPNNAIEQHYNAKQACQLLGNISRSTLDRLVRDGFLQKTKLGGRTTLFSASAIRDCLATRQPKQNHA